MTFTRRGFIKRAIVAAVAAPNVYPTGDREDLLFLNRDLEVHLFSKHLQFLDISKAGQVAAELGFDGLDLTVRPKGHVLPKNAQSRLSSVVEDLEKAGSKCKMITTAIADVSQPIDKAVIEAAGKAGIEYYRSNWFDFKKEISLEESLSHYKEKVYQLGELNKQNNIIGCYQNHSGIKVGASVWEVKKILESVDPKYFGTQYDIRHAVVEGGRSWSNGVKLLKDHIKTIVLKDFKWGRVKGKWQIINVPLGEGMVDFDAYFKLLKALGLKPPVSLHLEYPLGGANKGHYDITVNPKIVYDAMKKDLVAVQRLWMQA